MALINCPECESKVSDKAKQCPNCGFPIYKIAKEEIAEEKTEQVLQQEEQVIENKSKNKKPIIIAAIIILVFVLIISLSKDNDNCTADSCKNTKIATGNYCSAHTCMETGCNSYKSKSNVYCSYHNSLYNSYYSDYSYQSIEDILVFSNVKLEDGSSYTYCNGTIKNTGSKTYYFVRVKAAFKDNYGNVIDTDWTYAVGSEGLAPGESTKFKLSVEKSYMIDDVTLSIIDYDT